jgi:hypothetical protein
MQRFGSKFVGFALVLGMGLGAQMRRVSSENKKYQASPFSSSVE